MLGLKLAALYSIKPHQLGFCGPQEKKNKNVLFKYLKGKKISEKRIRKILEGFEGAYPYYKLIAKGNNIKDPLDEKVVKAYWVGNELLDKVKISDLQKMITKDFSRPGLLPEEIAIKKARSISENSRPHHSFHVLVIGSVTGRIVLRGKLLDLCRICWGEVKLKIKNEKLKVEYRPLMGKKKLRLGNSIKKEIDWDKALLPNIKIGDWVSFHWNQAIQILNKKDKKNLEKYTKNSLEIHNKLNL